MLSSTRSPNFETPVGEPRYLRKVREALSEVTAEAVENVRSTSLLVCARNSSGHVLDTSPANTAPYFVKNPLTSQQYVHWSFPGCER